MGRTWPDVPSHEIGRFYPAVYYGKENVRFHPLLERLTRLFRLRRARVVRQRVKPGTALDVGCGRGFTLSYLESLGFKAHGMEISDTAAWHARNVLGIEVETGDFLKSSHQKDLYNVVIFWHSLEHLPGPIEALGRAHALLRKGGLLVVAVPNFDSLQARLFGRYWFHLDIPRHYFHFGKNTLKKTLHSQGFRIVQMNHGSFEQNPYGWLQSFYNALGFDNNFLYSILKNKTARTHQIRQHPIQTALTLILLPLFSLFSLALMLVETALRQGGSIEVYAVKR
jgi:2-polyprenyl-3-methyl-5-hydroxy-6-metoxy-1,4-benzoquinol methylase